MQEMRRGGSFFGPRLREIVPLRGADVLDLLQRLSATDLLDWGPSQARPALFTNDKGRVVDLVLLLKDADGISVIPGPGRAQLFSDWLDRFIFTEDVEIQTAQERWSLERLSVGPGAKPFEFELPIQLGMSAITLSRDSEGLLELAAQLEADGFEKFDDDARRQLLLGQGVLAPGDGLDDRVNALEAGLRDFVAFDKGCYVGQEVIARLENYDKLRRAISVVRGVGAAPEVSEGLFVDGRSVGKILQSQACGDDGFIAIALTNRDVAQGSKIILGKNSAGTLQWIPAKQSQSQN